MKRTIVLCAALVCILLTTACGNGQTTATTDTSVTTETTAAPTTTTTTTTTTTKTTTTTTAATTTTAFVPIEERTFTSYTELLDAIQSQPVFEGHKSVSGAGILYDVDGNGVKELIMVYDDPLPCEVDGHSVYTVSTSCGIYTMQDGEVVTLVKERLPGILDGVVGRACIVTYQGGTYVAVKNQAGNGCGPERGNPIRYEGTYHLYDIDGATVSTRLSVEYTYRLALDDNFDSYVIYDGSQAVINGETCSFDVFEALEDSIEIREWVDATRKGYGMNEDGDLNVEGDGDETLGALREYLEAQG